MIDHDDIAAALDEEARWTMNERLARILSAGAREIVHLRRANNAVLVFGGVAILVVLIFAGVQQ